MPWFGLYSTNLNGPVPIGYCACPWPGRGRDRPANTPTRAGDKGGLPLLQTERHLVVAAGGDLGEVLVPGGAEICPQPVLRASGQQVPGAFDVGGSERLAVMPFDALAEFERQRRAVLVPGPFRSQLRPDRRQAVLRDVLIVKDEVVEDPHHRRDDRVGPLLVDRHAGRAVAVRHFQDSAGLLRERPPDARRSKALCRLSRRICAKPASWRVLPFKCRTVCPSPLRP